MWPHWGVLSLYPVPVGGPGGLRREFYHPSLSGPCASSWPVFTPATMRVACSGGDMRSKGGWIALGDLGSGRWTGLREDKMLPIASRSEVLQCVEERRGLGWGHQGCQGARRGPLGEAPALGILLHCSYGLELGWVSLRLPSHLVVWVWGRDRGSGLGGL